MRAWLEMAVYDGWEFLRVYQGQARSGTERIILFCSYGANDWMDTQHTMVEQARNDGWETIPKVGLLSNCTLHTFLRTFSKYRINDSVHTVPQHFSSHAHAVP